MSTCACIKKREFDISVGHRGCEFLVLEDQSEWVSKDGYNKPETYDLTIDAQSRGTKVTIPINTNCKTFLTSVDLFGSKTIKRLPDGFYCFSTESCGYKLTINRVSLCNIEIKLNDLIAKYSPTMSEEERRHILDLKLQMQSIKINTEKGNLETAKGLFKSVKEKLKLYHCDNC